MTGAGSVLTASLEPTWAAGPCSATSTGWMRAEATAARMPTGRAGYLGTALGLSLRQRITRELSWFAAAELNAMQGATNPPARCSHRAAT